MQFTSRYRLKLIQEVLHAFADYLMTIAKIPSYESAGHYLSAIYTNAKLCLMKIGWDINQFDCKKIRQGLRTFYASKAAEEHRSMSKPHEAASTDDLISIATLCIVFEGSSHSDMLAVFMLLVLSTVQLAGRASETSLIIKEVSRKDLNERNSKNRQEKILTYEDFDGT